MIEEESIRVVRPDEYDLLIELLDSAYGNFHSSIETRRQLSSKYFDPNSCFVSDRNGILNASIALTNLPKKGWFVLRYLALRDSHKDHSLAIKLVEKAVDKARTCNAEHIRCTTPRLEPYLSIYREQGFVPVRRDFRIRWNIPNNNESTDEQIKLQPVTETEYGLVSDIFLLCIANIWDWRTIEQGGPEHVAENFIEGLKHGQKWMFALDEDNKIVGATGLIPNDGGPGKARFRGAYVLPEIRKQGYGMMIMRAVFDWARKIGQEEMTIYTFSYLDHYTPGAILYLKSGGKIESEYLQFEKPLT